MENYKDEIISTRVGCLGSSDGKLLRQVAELGYVPKSAYERLSIVKGLKESDNVTTVAMRAGDKMEQAIFAHLSVSGKKYMSNPLWESKKYSVKNCRLISHPDIVLEDEESCTMMVYEVKTTKFDVDDTYSNYEAQLFIHWLLAVERAKKLGRKWRVRLFLVHYSTENLDVSENMDFDPERLTVKEAHFKSPLFDIKKAMSTVNDFLESFTGYEKGEEVDADLMPMEVRKQFDVIEGILLEIKEREKRVGEFKKKLYDFLVEKGIKNIKAFSYTISRIDPTELVTIDYKAFFDDYKKKHPKNAAKAEKEYRKVTKKKGFAMFKLK